MDRRLNKFSNSLPHIAIVSNHIVPRYAQYLIPQTAQVLITNSIMFNTFDGEMMFAIDFDNQLQFDAAEIDRVRRNWKFSSKLLVVALPIANPLPDVGCKFVGCLPLRFGEFD